MTAADLNAASGHRAVAHAPSGIRFEKTRRLKDGGYCLAAHHPSFEQSIRFTITPAADGGPWQILAWVMTQTGFDNDTWSFPQLEATPLDSQRALEEVLSRVAVSCEEDPRMLSVWVFEISAVLARVLRYVAVYDAVGFSWRPAA